MASIEMNFEAKSYVHASKLHQQLINQMKPLNYEVDSVQMKPISEHKIKTTIIFVYKKNSVKKEKAKTPWGSKNSLAFWNVGMLGSFFYSNSKTPVYNS